MKIKYLAPVLLMAIIIAFVGCSKGPDKLIVNTWKVTNVVSKGTYNDSLFQAINTSLMTVDMTFKDNKFTMKSGGNVIESGTYKFENNKLTVITEKGMNMDAIVTKENLTLDTPDFMTTLQPI